MERAPTAPLGGTAWGLPAGAGCGTKGRRRPGGVRVEQLAEYPVRTRVFEAGDSLHEVSIRVGMGV